METVLRAAIMYCFIWLVMRAVGRKELSGMSAFELVLLVVMGDLIQQGVTQQDTSVTAAMLAVATMALLVVVTSYVSFRWNRASRIVEGLSVVIVRNGRIQRKLLEMERLTEDDVKEAARLQGIADLRDVAVGVLESDGQFSFVKNGHTNQQQRATSGQQDLAE
jgi:uncharacterized membrane protein YcaP (DUF421 family)